MNKGPKDRGNLILLVAAAAFVVGVILIGLALSHG